MATAIPLSEPQLGRLARLKTATLSDALDSLGIVGGCQGLLPLARGTRIAGPALTLRYLPAGLSGGTVGDYLHLAKQGDVIVIDNAGRTDCTVWGGILSELAHKAGVAGTVIDGVSRDVDRTIELGYPMFSRGAHMVTGKGRIALEQINGPVALGRVRVEPGDIVVGDDSGVVVIPASRFEDVLEKAIAIDEAEQAVLKDVAGGMSLEAARKRHNYHLLQARTGRGTK
ncbi:MAG TPA: RraA family protein [Alphaproteobacteria bacterium]|nr:RraA family protein [Alphaproteobacteria bacterium]